MKFHNCLVRHIPQLFTPNNIVSGYKVTEIRPLNKEIFTDEDFLSSAEKVDGKKKSNNEGK